MVRVRSRGRGRGRGRGRCRSRSRIDVEDESEDTSLEVEHQNEATSLEVEHQNEATSLEVEDQNEATSLEIKDQNEATSLEINDQNEATSLEIKDQNEATSLEINDQNEATSLEIKDQNEVTSLEFEDQNEITNLKVEVQNEITNLKVEVQNEVTGTGAEDHNKVTSLEVEDHNEVTSLEVEVQNEVTSLEVEVQNEVTSLEIENQNKVTSLEVEDHCKVTSLEIEYTNKVTSLEVEDHCKVTSLEVEDHNKVTSLEVEDHCKVGLEVEGSSFKDGNGLCDENAKVSAEENLPCEQNNKEKLRPEKMYNVTWIGRRVRRLEDEVDIVSEPSDDEVTMLEADAGVAKVVENVVQMDSNRPDENEQCDIERGTLEEEQVTATSVEKQHADTFEEQVETKKQPLDDDDVIEGPIDPQDQCAEKTEEPLQSCKQDEVENVETKSTKYEEHQTQTDHKEIVLSNVQQEPFVEIIERQTETSKKDSLEENTASSGSATEGPRRTRQGLRSSSKTRIKTEEPLQSCKQDDLENVETKSTKHEEHHTEANKKEIVLSNVQQEQIVEIMEQETEISKKDSLQENMTSSDSTTEGPRHTRQGLRSSKKKEDAAPSSHTKTQSELVTPVRRSLRSNKTSSEPAVISEAPDNSKEEEVTYLGRTRASKRKPGTAEAEQVSSTRKTRRTGL
ncbi:uncharacterized protein LOC143552670 [Bidens hawaiensis]|uniref:uncharacterized protein LOC143552670 n=1 Tax=Bidens hawaiensis TaxID=980011 RepID=UPI0040493CD6